MPFLNRLPVEMLVKVFCEFDDFSQVIELAMTCKHMCGIWKKKTRTHHLEHWEKADCDISRRFDGGKFV